MPDGRAILLLDTEPIYMQKLARGTSPAAGQKAANFRRFGTFDHGIRASRCVGPGLSGARGAPVLFVVVDRTTGAQDLTWDPKLAREAGPAKVDGNTVVVGDSAGANLKCAFTVPGAPTLTGAIRATGGAEYFAIATVQDGAAPTLKAKGDGLSAKVSAGGQTVRFDGEKMESGKGIAEGPDSGCGREAHLPGGRQTRLGRARGARQAGRHARPAGAGGRQVGSIGSGAVPRQPLRRRGWRAVSNRCIDAYGGTEPC